MTDYPLVHCRLEDAGEPVFSATMEVRPASWRHYKLKHIVFQMLWLHLWALVNKRFRTRLPHLTMVMSDGTVYAPGPVSKDALVHEFCHLWQNYREGLVRRGLRMAFSADWYAFYELEAYEFEGRTFEEAVHYLTQGAYWLRGHDAEDLTRIANERGLWVDDPDDPSHLRTPETR